MGLFKDIYCTKCGKKTKMLTRMKLDDGSYLCWECQNKVPSFMWKTMADRYSFEDYEALLDYIDYSQRELKPIFRETHYYYSIHMDAENKLFYIGHVIDKTTPFFHMYNVEDFDLIFRVEEFKEGMTGNKVSGKVLLQVKVSTPYFYHEEILDRSAKAKAKKKLLSGNVEYENPKGMDDFTMHFVNAWKKSLEEYIYENEKYVDNDDYYSGQTNTSQAAPSELQQAMALFMLDSLDDMTQESLKAHRNRMIKAFHPDKSGAADTRYAQKINAAYEVLKKYLE